MNKGKNAPDLKAEVLAGELTANRRKDKIYFNRIGSFNRNYNKDVNSVEEIPGSNDLVIVVNREGLYDYLPEEVFHFDTYTASKKNQERESNKTRHQKIKLQENEARKFFSPIETEFDALLLDLEIQERKLFDSAVLNPFLIKFYESELKSNLLEQEQKKVLIHLFPYLYQFKNNHHFFKFALERILKVKSDVWVERNIVQLEYANVRSLGKIVLGLDSVCGQKVYIEQMQLHVVLYLDGYDSIEACLEKGNYSKILHYLKELIMDYNLDLHIFYNFEQVERDWVVSDSKMRLGLNTFA